MNIATKVQARAAAHKVADLLWAAQVPGTITFEQADELAGRCIDLVFDGLTPAAAVAQVVAAATGGA